MMMMTTTTQQDKILSLWTNVIASLNISRTIFCVSLKRQLPIYCTTSKLQMSMILGFTLNLSMTPDLCVQLR